MSEHPPQSIDLREEVRLYYKEFLDKVKAIQDAYNSFTTGQNELGIHSFPDGFFASNIVESKMLKDSLESRIIPTEDNEKYKREHTIRIGEWSILEGRITMAENLPGERYGKTIPIWFVVDDFGDEAFLTINKQK